MLNNLLIATGTIVDLAIAALLLIVAVVGFCTGFMKNGLNNLFFAAKIVVIALLVPVLNKIGFIADMISALGGAFDFIGSTETQNAIAGVIIGAAEAIVLFILLSVVFGIVKWLLRKLAPKRGILKLIDRILGAVFGVALYGVLFLGILGVVGTIDDEKVQSALRGSKFQSINFMQDFCDKNLNLGDLIKDLSEKLPDGGGDGSPETPGGGEETPGGDDAPEVPEEQGGAA